MDAASVLAQLGRAGEPATLRSVISTRAPTGGAIAQTTTDHTVSLVRTLQEVTVEGGQPRRRVEVILAGAEPTPGDVLVIAGGLFSVASVSTVSRGGIPLCFEVVLT